MQDRFRFRVWDTQKGYISPMPAMVYNAEKTYDTMYGCDVDSFGEVLEDDRFIVMQCTGLKDKNGKLIYEGDIVTYDSTDLFPHTTIKTGKITWYKSHWTIEYCDKNIVYMGTNEPALQRIWLGSDDFIGSRTEIVGNIYENLELLEVNNAN